MASVSSFMRLARISSLLRALPCLYALRWLRQEAVASVACSGGCSWLLCALLFPAAAHQGDRATGLQGVMGTSLLVGVSTLALSVDPHTDLLLTILQLATQLLGPWLAQSEPTMGPGALVATLLVAMAASLASSRLRQCLKLPHGPAGQGQEVGNWRRSMRHAVLRPFRTPTTAPEHAAGHNSSPQPGSHTRHPSAASAEQALDVVTAMQRAAEALQEGPQTSHSMASYQAAGGPATITGAQGSQVSQGHQAGNWVHSRSVGPPSDAASGANIEDLMAADEVVRSLSVGERCAVDAPTSFSGQLIGGFETQPTTARPSPQPGQQPHSLPLLRAGSTPTWANAVSLPAPHRPPLTEEPAAGSAGRAAHVSTPGGKLGLPQPSQGGSKSQLTCELHHAGVRDAPARTSSLPVATAAAATSMPQHATSDSAGGRALSGQPGARDQGSSRRQQDPVHCDVARWPCTYESRMQSGDGEALLDRAASTPTGASPAEEAAEDATPAADKAPAPGVHTPFSVWLEDSSNMATTSPAPAYLSASTTWGSTAAFNPMQSGAAAVTEMECCAPDELQATKQASTVKPSASPFAAASGPSSERGSTAIDVSAAPSSVDGQAPLGGQESAPVISSSPSLIQVQELYPGMRHMQQPSIHTHGSSLPPGDQLLPADVMAMAAAAEMRWAQAATARAASLSSHAAAAAAAAAAAHSTPSSPGLAALSTASSNRWDGLAAHFPQLPALSAREQALSSWEHQSNSSHDLGQGADPSQPSTHTGPAPGCGMVVPMTEPPALCALAAERAATLAADTPRRAHTSLSYHARTRCSVLSVKVHSHQGTHDEYAERLSTAVSGCLRTAADASLNTALALARAARSPAGSGDQPEPAPHLASTSLIHTATVRGCVHLFAWVHGPAGEPHMVANQPQHPLATAGATLPQGLNALAQQQQQQQQQCEHQYSALAATLALTHKAAAALSLLPGFSLLHPDQQASAVVAAASAAAHVAGSGLTAIHDVLAAVPDAQLMGAMHPHHASHSAALPTLPIQPQPLQHQVSGFQQPMWQGAHPLLGRQPTPGPLPAPAALPGVPHVLHGIPAEPVLQQLMPPGPPLLQEHHLMPGLSHLQLGGVQHTQQAQPQPSAASLFPAGAPPPVSGGPPISLECMWSPCVSLAPTGCGPVWPLSEVLIMMSVAEDVTIRFIIINGEQPILDTCVMLHAQAGNQLIRLQPPPQHELGCLRVILTPQPRSPQANHAIIYDTAMLLAVPHTVACELQQLVQVMRVEFRDSGAQTEAVTGSSSSSGAATPATPGTPGTTGGSSGSSSGVMGLPPPLCGAPVCGVGSSLDSCVWREHYAPFISDLAFIIEQALQPPHTQQQREALLMQVAGMMPQLEEYLKANNMPATSALLQQAADSLATAAERAAGDACSSSVLRQAEEALLNTGGSHQCMGSGSALGPPSTSLVLPCNMQPAYSFASAEALSADALVDPEPSVGTQSSQATKTSVDEGQHSFSSTTAADVRRTTSCSPAPAPTPAPAPAPAPCPAPAPALAPTPAPAPASPLSSPAQVTAPASAGQAPASAWVSPFSMSAATPFGDEDDDDADVSPAPTADAPGQHMTDAPAVDTGGLMVVGGDAPGSWLKAAPAQGGSPTDCQATGAAACPEVWFGTSASGAVTASQLLQSSRPAAAERPGAARGAPVVAARGVRDSTEAPVTPAVHDAVVVRASHDSVTAGVGMPLPPARSAGEQELSPATAADRGVMGGVVVPSTPDRPDASAPTHPAKDTSAAVSPQHLPLATGSHPVTQGDTSAIDLRQGGEDVTSSLPGLNTSAQQSTAAAAAPAAPSQSLGRRATKAKRSLSLPSGFMHDEERSNSPTIEQLSAPAAAAPAAHNTAHQYTPALRPAVLVLVFAVTSVALVVWITCVVGSSRWLVAPRSAAMLALCLWWSAALVILSCAHPSAGAYGRTLTRVCTSEVPACLALLLGAVAPYAVWWSGLATQPPTSPAAAGSGWLLLPGATIGMALAWTYACQVVFMCSPAALHPTSTSRAVTPVSLSACCTLLPSHMDSWGGEEAPSWQLLRVAGGVMVVAASGGVVRQVMARAKAWLMHARQV